MPNYGISSYDGQPAAERPGWLANDGCQAAAPHPHRPGRIAVGHIGGQVPLSVPQPIALEIVESAIPIDPHCPDCASEVTLLLGHPPVVDAAVAVRHSEGCPELALLVRQGGAA